MWKVFLGVACKADVFCGANDLDVEVTESWSESKAAAINVPQGRAVVEKKRACFAG